MGTPDNETPDVESNSTQQTATDDSCANSGCGCGTPSAEGQANVAPVYSDPDALSDEETQRLDVESRRAYQALQDRIAAEELRAAELTRRLPANHPVASFVGATEITASDMTHYMDVYITRPWEESDKLSRRSPTGFVEDQAREYGRDVYNVYFALAQRLAHYGVDNLIKTHGVVLTAIDPRMTKLIQTGKLIDHENKLRIDVSKVRQFSSHGAYLEACRVLVEDFRQACGKGNFFLKKVEVAAGPDIPPGMPYEEVQALEQKYAMSKPQLGGYMVVYWAHNKWYIGVSMIDGAARRAGLLNRNFHLWRAIRYSQTLQMISDRDRVAHDRDQLEWSIREQRSMLLKRHIQDVIGEGPHYDVANGVAATRVAQHQTALEALEEAKADLTTDPMVISDLERQVFRTNTHTRIDPSALTAEQFEILGMINARLAEHHERKRHAAQARRKGEEMHNATPQGKEKPVELTVVPAPWTSPELRDMILTYGFESPHSAVAEDLRATLESHLRKVGWQPGHAAQRMMNYKELVASLPNWGNHSRQPILDFFSECRSAHTVRLRQAVAAAEDVKLANALREQPQTEPATPSEAEVPANVNG